jgi:chromosomal replication initiation ATPase DnaA
MSNPVFICPCCGARPVYSKELARDILSIVSSYFQVDPESVIKNRSPHGKEGRVRSFTVYLIRRFTGEWLKVVGEIFNQSGPATGLQITRIENQIFEDKEAKKELEDLLALIKESANIIGSDTSYYLTQKAKR